MTSRKLRVATRRSPLALWQAHYVRDALLAAEPGLEVELLEMTTRGDKILDSPLAKIGGKGLFVKELEQAMLEGRADLAVHSMKDVPMALPEGFALACICAREEPRDALVSGKYRSLDELPQGAKVGSSSLRRQCQLRALRPDLALSSLRGNVNTRLAKLDAGEFDAIVLAAAGLIRLEMPERIAQLLPDDSSLPAVGQGAVGIECRADDSELIALLASLHCERTAVCVNAERAMNRRLEGGCQVPIAGFAQWQGERIVMRARVGDPESGELLKVAGESAPEAAEAMGQRLADDLLALGADAILQRVYNA